MNILIADLRKLIRVAGEFFSHIAATQSPNSVCSRRRVALEMRTALTFTQTELLFFWKSIICLSYTLNRLGKYHASFRHLSTLSPEACCSSAEGCEVAARPALLWPEPFEPDTAVIDAIQIQLPIQTRANFLRAIGLKNYRNTEGRVGRRGRRVLGHGLFSFAKSDKFYLDRANQSALS